MEEICLDEWCGKKPTKSLEELKETISRLQEKYGKNALAKLSTESGYDNVYIYVTIEKSNEH